MSKRTTAQATILIAFVLALSAGVVVGMAWARHTPPVPVPTTAARSWLGDELDLTAQQSEQMRTLWQQAMQGPAKSASERRHALQIERDEAMLKLLSVEQRAEYDKLMQDYSLRIADAGKERDKAIQDAVEETKKLLQEPQRKKYEELMLKERSGHNHWGRGPHQPETRPAARSATQPAASQGVHNPSNPKEKDHV